MGAFPSEQCCIVTKNSDTWYCKKCKKAHNRLYVNNRNNARFCPDCVPAFIKAISVDIDHNNNEL